MSARALLAAALLASGCGGPEPPPNLLLVIADTLRPDPLACYGGPADVGTSICALAEHGTRFVWALATVPYTAPSVASIFTSRYPSEHGLSQFSSEPLAEDLPTLAGVLSAGGYATASFVSNPVLGHQRALGRGFDLYDDAMDVAEVNRPGYRERTAERTTDAALAWARTAPEPWFLVVHYQDPHGPYAPPGAPPLSDAAGAARLSVLEDHSGFEGIPRYQALPELFSAAAYQRRYLDEIRYLDRHLGRLVAELDAAARPPVVVFTADHGEAFGEDGYYFAHGHSLALDQIRVPLLWRGRSPTPPRVVAGPVSTLDLAPTLLEAAGLAAPPSFAGVPLRLRPDASETPRPPFFAEHLVRFAVVKDDVYYARDVVPLGEEARDPNTDGLLRPLPARRARLAADGRAPEYAPVSEVAQRQHEAEVREALARARAAAALPAPAPDEETRRMLRDLGYLD